MSNIVKKALAYSAPMQRALNRVTRLYLKKKKPVSQKVIDKQRFERPMKMDLHKMTGDKVLSRVELEPATTYEVADYGYTPHPDYIKHFKREQIGEERSVPNLTEAIENFRSLEEGDDENAKFIASLKKAFGNKFHAERDVDIREGIASAEINMRGAKVRMGVDSGGTRWLEIRRPLVGLTAAAFDKIIKAL